MMKLVVFLAAVVTAIVVTQTLPRCEDKWKFGKIEIVRYRIFGC